MAEVTTAKKITDDLIKSGFPAEVKVASILAKHHWMIYPGALFEDSDSDKPREIDIHSVFVDYTLAGKVPRKDEGNENKLISHLIVEVKKSDKPWVFFNNAQRNWPGIPANTFKSDDEGFHYSFTLYEEPTDFPVKDHRFMKSEFHKSFHVAFSDPTKNSPIYESFVKVKKALEFFKNRYSAGGYVLHVFIPIVVIDGTLWSAKLKKDGTPSIKQVSNLMCTFGYLEKHEDINLTTEEEQIIDVVTIEYFEKLLEIISKDNRGIYKAWTKNNLEK